MNLGPRKMSRLRLLRNRPLAPGRRVVVLLLASFCMIAAGLPVHIRLGRRRRR